jgi:hypothetical protein
MSNNIKDGDVPRRERIPPRREILRKTRNPKALAERLLKIGRQCARLPLLDTRSADEMLYDELGLPK